MSEITIPYVHRITSAKTHDYGDQYGQTWEPVGEYLSQHDYRRGDPSKTGNVKDWAGATWYEYGQLHLSHPCVIRLAEGESPIAWKKELSEAVRGLRGKRLTAELVKRGHDGVVVYAADGEISEIVNFSGKKTIIQPMPVEALKYGRGGKKGGS